MTIELSAHLSEEALNDALIGLSFPEPDAHLAVCGFCRGQLEAVRTDLQAFNRTSLAWSEARLEARPAKSIGAAARLKVHHAMRAPLGWALAAAVLLAIGVPVWNHDYRASLKYGSAPALAPEDSAAQIAQDNDLMRSVDTALNAPEASPIREYNLSNGPQLRLKPRPELRNR
jgi:hypothetical protein